MQPAEFVSVTV
jgi:hypothetical protein